MEFNNDRDRFSYGYDAGVIVDGKVMFDDQRKEYLVIDDDGVAFSIQAVLETLINKKVRITCISLESIENIQKMLVTSPTNPDSSHNME